ncbi:hypothetical protein ACIQNU_41535 [Streptomyces sp. NPDC091292]|uniref:hypothetical protein n=1 Tax=Streptomyces sp. NPDC091292 TaxID=3365991 RepID=UPI003828F497
MNVELLATQNTARSPDIPGARSGTAWYWPARAASSLVAPPAASDTPARRPGRHQDPAVFQSMLDAAAAARTAEGAGHVDLYDKEEYVGPAVTELTGFFRTELAEQK